jgi:hypothetical protein
MNKDLLKTILDQQVDSITNQELKELVYKILENLPSGFWTRECSKAYHPADERGEAGNLLHSLRVARVAMKLMEPTQTSQEDRELLKAASLLHDCIRHGLTGTAPYSVKDHPELVRQFIKDKNLECELSDKLCKVIETHMGPWGITPFFPTLDLNSALQLADYIASQVDIKVEI